jgi:hypothetical protein
MRSFHARDAENVHQQGCISVYICWFPRRKREHDKYKHYADLISKGEIF